MCYKCPSKTSRLACFLSFFLWQHWGLKSGALLLLGRHFPFEPLHQPTYRFSRRNLAVNLDNDKSWHCSQSPYPPGKSGPKGLGCDVEVEHLPGVRPEFHP
jgi:hypothetical protein